MNPVSKVSQVTLAFWVMKICATTLGETGGDLLSMTLDVGYLVSTLIFFAVFLVLLVAQVRARTFHPYLYWAVIIATTTCGTTMSDYLDRTAGLGYLGGSLVLVSSLICVLAVWRMTLGTVSVDHITDWRMETFYWVTILFSNTLGTALGDCMADSWALGYVRVALIIFGLLAILLALYFLTSVSRTVLFWLAFVLTRPLGAALGDLLTKSHEQGGLDLGTRGSSAVLAVFLVICIGVYHGRRSAVQGRPAHAH